MVKSEVYARRLVELGVIEGPLDDIAAVSVTALPGKTVEVTVTRKVTADQIDLVALATLE